MSIQVDVKDSVITTTNTVKKIEINVIDYKLYTSARLQVKLKDVNDRAIDFKYFTLEGASFDNWGSDDVYIKNYVLSNLSLTESVV